MRRLSLTLQLIIVAVGEVQNSILLSIFVVDDELLKSARKYGPYRVCHFELLMYVKRKVDCFISRDDPNDNTQEVSVFKH